MHPRFPNQYIMQGSILSVHVIDARELVNTAQPRIPVNARVRLSMEQNHSNTQEVPGTNNPVWNEVIAFDIMRGVENLHVQV